MATAGVDSRPSGRVLVVEDDASLARVLVRVVSPFAEPVVAATVREAIVHVTRDRECRAAIVDLALPDGSGLDVLAHARRSGHRMPAMLLTGCVDAAASNAAFDMGALYVVKPVVSQRIERFIHETGQRPASVPATLPPRNPSLSTNAAMPVRGPTGSEKEPSSVASRLLATMAEAAVAELLAQYEVGLAVHRIRYPAPGQSPRSHDMSALARRLGLDLSALRRRARVTEVIAPGEFFDLVRFRSPRGLPLTWSHMEILATVRVRSRREAIARQVAEKELGIRECIALVRTHQPNRAPENG